MGTNCLNCNRNFEQEHPAQFWCSMECAKEWKRKQIFSEDEKIEIRRIVKEELNKLK